MTYSMYRPYRITLSAFEPGKLCLELDFFNGVTFSARATPSTIRKVLGEQGLAVTADQLAAAAFRGERYTFSLEPGAASVAFTYGWSPFDAAREAQRTWFALSQAWLRACGEALDKPEAQQVIPLRPRGDVTQRY
jgi:hypothetical protein